MLVRRVVYNALRYDTVLSTLAEGLQWEKLLERLDGFVCYVHSFFSKYRLWKHFFSRSTSENLVVSAYTGIALSPRCSCQCSDLTEN